ncbi:hypothetical protein, partial [Paraburkholderia fungorum]|uniref:hypothetical protein n=1 Tax=Paraburkholderia fungorum TaxID=134537 RepID=UPI001C3F4A2A
RQRKVGAAPHRGNANRPLTKQGKAKAPKDQQQSRPRTHKKATPKSQINNKPAEQAKKPKNTLIYPSQRS